MVGITRPGTVEGRGGVRCSAFRAADYRPEADEPPNALGTPEACGQVPAARSGGVSESQAWHAFTWLAEQILPTALREGMRRFLDLDPANPCHGLNFCQGTVAEMSPDPNRIVRQAIAEFGAHKRIFMVHFRNIKGGYCDFHETFPDEGDVDMPAAIHAYRAVGYDGLLCPDHVPLSDLAPGRERFFAFALGYTRALLQAA